jgi:hypothetical protein
VVATGDAGAARLWQEYEAATFGRCAIRWSNGLRARLLGSEDSCTDVEAAAAEGEGITLLRAMVGADEWNRINRQGLAGHLLTSIEEAAGMLLAMAEGAGHHVQPIDLP